MGVIRRWASLFLTLTALHAQPPAQTVIVDVLVSGKNGPITGLTKEDFKLKINGKEQKLLDAVPVASHLDAWQPKPLDPRIAANRTTWQTEPARSATVILFDRLNMPAINQAAARDQLLQVLASLTTADLVTVASLHRELTLVHDFTANTDLLAQAARRLIAGAAAPDAASQSLQDKLDNALTPAPPFQPGLILPATSQALQSIRMHLAGLPGRKSLIWVGEPPLGTGVASFEDANIAVYLISPNGVAGLSAAPRVVMPPQGPSAPAPAGATLVVLQPVDLRMAMGGPRLGAESAEATGGRAVYNSNDFRTDLRTLLDENHLQYSLAFAPEPKLRDGKTHDLNIEVAKSKLQDASVRYHRHYRAPKAAEAVPIDTLAADPLNATSLGLVAVASPDQGKPGNRQVDISLQPGDLTWQQNAGLWTNGGLELLLYVEGGGDSSLKSFQLSFTDQQRANLANGLVIYGSVAVRSPDDIIRVVVREPATGLAGSLRLRAGP